MDPPSRCGCHSCPRNRTAGAPRGCAVSDAEDILSFVGDPEFEEVERRRGRQPRDPRQGDRAERPRCERRVDRPSLRHHAQTRRHRDWRGLAAQLVQGTQPRQALATRYRAPIGGRPALQRQCVRCFARFAFEELHLHRVEAFPTMDNRASVRLLERLGFTREGTARDVLLMDNGLYHSVGQFSMPDSEYQPE